MISSCLGGVTHSTQTARPQNITPDYAAPTPDDSALASTFTANSA
jgi:hypothetical protein